jgi:hypothetical protein
MSIKKTIKEIVKIGDFVYNPNYTNKKYQSGPDGEKELVAPPLLAQKNVFEEIEGLISTGKIHGIWTLKLQDVMTRGLLTIKASKLPYLRI